MNRRENFMVAKIDGDAAREARRVAMRDIAMDAVAGAMREFVDPLDRFELARELCSASAMTAVSACGGTVASTHLSKLSGQVFRASEDAITQRKRRGR